jgi:hypothetical protein
MRIKVYTNEGHIGPLGVNLGGSNLQLRKLKERQYSKESVMAM